MPQYYFTIRWPDREKYDRDCRLPNDRAALDCAARRISELKKDSRYDHPGLDDREKRGPQDSYRYRS
jgi:hypothetical protein